MLRLIQFLWFGKCEFNISVPFTTVTNGPWKYDIIID